MEGNGSGTCPRGYRFPSNLFDLEHPGEPEKRPPLLYADRGIPVLSDATQPGGTVGRYGPAFLEDTLQRFSGGDRVIRDIIAVLASEEIIRTYLEALGD